MGLKLIDKKEISKEVVEKFNYDFVLANDGLYLIEIIASAKSWWQNFKSARSLFKDDDLALTLDRIEISSSTSALTDVRAAWNGNELKGLLKTVVIAVKLKSGKHILSFAPDQKPYLKNIIISQAEEMDKVTYIPADNNPAEKADGRPWLSFILINLSIKDLAISAKGQKRGRDDDDIKLIIDGKIQKNQDKKSHQDWYWCGKILKGKEKVFIKEVNWQGGFHYFNLWADESPFLYKAELALADNSKPRTPSVDNPEWTGDFDDDSEEIILARLIFGEANNQPLEAKAWIAWSVINRIEANSWWPKTIHEVILQEGQYDPFKPLDQNYKKIINPLNYEKISEMDRKSWYECYKIAQDVVLGKTANPTTATHFFGKGIAQKWFEKNVVPKGNFLKKIGDTYFYWSPN